MKSLVALLALLALPALGNVDVVLGVGGPSAWGGSGANQAASWTTTPAPTPRYLTGGIEVSNCVAAYEAKGAASLSASYTNLANPGTYTITTSAAPTWDATAGWKGNGSQWMDTGIQVESNWTFIIRYNNIVVGDGVEGIYSCGAGNASQNFGCIAYRSLHGRYYYCGGGVEIANYATNGVMASATNGCYFNGVLEGTPSQPAGCKSTYSFKIFRMNSYANTAKHSIQALYIYNATLTSNQVYQVSTNMAAL